MEKHSPHVHPEHFVLATELFEHVAGLGIREMADEAEIFELAQTIPTLRQMPYVFRISLAQTFSEYILKEITDPLQKAFIGDHIQTSLYRILDIQAEYE